MIVTCRPIIFDTVIKVDVPMLIKTSEHPDATSTGLTLEDRKFDIDKLFSFQNAFHICINSNEGKIIASTDPHLVKSGLLPISEEDIHYLIGLYDNNQFKNIQVEYKESITGQCDCMCHEPGVSAMHIIPCCDPVITMVPDKNEDGTIKILKD